MQLNKVEVQKGAVSTIVGDGKLVGIIFHDQASHKKVIYKCIEMDEDEIADLMSRGTVSQEQ